MARIAEGLAQEKRTNREQLAFTKALLSESHPRNLPVLLKLLLAFTVVPLVELMILIRLAGETSLLTTIAIVLVTGVIGSVLAKWQGSQAWFRFRKALAEGRVPAPEVQDGLLIFFAAGLLLTPGLLTDAFGFFLLAPPTRVLVRLYLARRLKGKVQFHTSGFGASPQSKTHESFDTRSGETLEPGEVRKVDEQSIG